MACFVTQQQLIIHPTPVFVSNLTRKKEYTCSITECLVTKQTHSKSLRIEYNELAVIYT